MRSSWMFYICKVASHCHHSHTLKSSVRKVISLTEWKQNVWFMFSHNQLVNLCHWIHMLGLSQHLFAEQHFDLVMTSGNVSFQQRRSSELGGVGRGRRGDSQGKEKKEGTGWGTVKGALLQSSSCFTTRSSCVDHRRCMGWMTNKFRKLSHVGDAHNKVLVNLQP